MAGIPFPLLLPLFQAGSLVQEPPLWLEGAREVWSYIEPYKYFLLVLVIFWIIARRSKPQREGFDAQAQRVLEDKYKRGEISQKAYEKYRQDIALRPKR